MKGLSTEVWESEGIIRHLETNKSWNGFLTLGLMEKGDFYFLWGPGENSSIIEEK